MGRNIFTGGKLEATGTSDIEELISRSRILSKAVKDISGLDDALVRAAQAVEDETGLNDRMFLKIVKADTVLQKAMKIVGFQEEFRKFLEAVIKIQSRTNTGKGTLTAAPGETEAAETQNTPSETLVAEWNQKLKELIDDIPTAYPGDIITSEHHNSLRRAIKALAALADDTETSSIHTFAPLFLPFENPKGDDQRMTHWKLLFDRAVVPTVQEMGGAGGVIKGGLLVRLPDDALIKSMIVRGKRLDDKLDDPKAFDVTLLRADPNKATMKPVELINFDLREENTFFVRTETPKSSIIVDNAKYHYYVRAVWADEDDSSGFEIRSIQFICEH
jgi:hypothetical protein